MRNFQQLSFQEKKWFWAKIHLLHTHMNIYIYVYIYIYIYICIYMYIHGYWLPKKFINGNIGQDLPTYAHIYIYIYWYKRLQVKNIRLNCHSKNRSIYLGRLHGIISWYSRPLHCMFLTLGIVFLLVFASRGMYLFHNCGSSVPLLGCKARWRDTCKAFVS